MKISFCEILIKQIASCVSTGTELLFEWSRHRISSADSKKKLECLYETPSNPLAANTISKHSTVVNYIVERDKEKKCFTITASNKVAVKHLRNTPDKIETHALPLIIISFYFRH